MQTLCQSYDSEFVKCWKSIEMSNLMDESQNDKLCAIPENVEIETAIFQEKNKYKVK